MVNFLQAIVVLAIIGGLYFLMQAWQSVNSKYVAEDGMTNYREMVAAQILWETDWTFMVDIMVDPTYVNTQIFGRVLAKNVQPKTTSTDFVNLIKGCFVVELDGNHPAKPQLTIQKGATTKASYASALEIPSSGYSNLCVVYTSATGNIDLYVNGSLGMHTTVESNFFDSTGDYATSRNKSLFIPDSTDYPNVTNPVPIKNMIGGFNGKYKQPYFINRALSPSLIQAFIADRVKNV